VVSCGNGGARVEWMEVVGARSRVSNDPVATSSSPREGERGGGLGEWGPV
jgi:hypothetical protein